MICFSCKKETDLIEPIGRRDECPHCGADARVCKNCEFYDIKVYNECREPKAERVLEKERSNFCDQFNPPPKKMGMVGASGSSPSARLFGSTVGKAAGNVSSSGDGSGPGNGSGIENGTRVGVGDGNRHGHGVAGAIKPDLKAIAEALFKKKS